MPHIGDRIKSALKSRGLTNADLARACDVTPQAVGSWVKSGKIDKKHLPVIARICSTSLDWLMSGTNLDAFVSSGPRHRGVSESRGAYPLEDTLDVPYMNALASAGVGAYPPEHEVIVGHMRVSQNWVRRNLVVSAPANLRTLQAYGDSMHPTFNDGDILFVDCGVQQIKLDAVYVLNVKDELYVKRVQRRPDGAFVVKSDNPLYDPIVVKPTNNHFQVLGRVIWVWNGRKL